jgi:hypothetical protein
MAGEGKTTCRGRPACFLSAPCALRPDPPGIQSAREKTRINNVRAHVASALILILPGIAAAQTPLATTPPTPRETARKLFDKAAQMAGVAQPHIHVMALTDLAIYQVFDKEKSIFFLRNAFAVTAAVPEEEGRNFRTQFQGEIVKKLAGISVSDACDMLRAMAEPGKNSGNGSPAKKVVDVLLAQDKPQFDRAIELVNLVPENAEYPFDAAERIFHKPPTGDSRIILFGNALSAYRRRPTRAGFPRMPARRWRELPRDNVQAAISFAGDAIRDRADDPNNTEASVTTSDGDVRRANSRKAKELLELIHVVRELDPKRASELLMKYPELQDAPKVSTEEPEAEAEQSEPTAFAMPLIPIHSSTNLAEMQPEMDNFGKMMDKAEKAVAMLKENPKEALSMAAELSPRFRVSLLAMLAETASGEHPALSQKLLDECAALLNEIKDPADRALPRASLAAAAHRLNNDKLALQLFQRALDDITLVYSQDTDADSPNMAMLEYWPSIQGCRLVIWRAAKALGIAAEPLLGGVRNDDLALLAHIEMGRMLLNQPRREVSIQFQHVSK